MLSSQLRTALTLLHHSDRHPHSPRGGCVADSTPQPHRRPALLSRHTAVAEDHRGGIRAWDVEGGTVAETEMIKDPASCAARPGEHLQADTGDSQPCAVQGRRDENNCHPLLPQNKGVAADGR